MGHAVNVSQRVAATIAALIALAFGFLAFTGPTAHADDGDKTDWESVSATISTTLSEIPGVYQPGDPDGEVTTLIRQAYYETYQVSGLEAEVRHRLGRERVTVFVDELLEIRTLARDGASAADVQAQIDKVNAQLKTDVADLANAKEVSGRWTVVANEIADLVNSAVEKYAAGDVEGAYSNATDSYLARYEADGLEKATIAYIGQGRVSDVEGLFTDLRQGIRNGQSVDEVRATGESLIAAVQEDAAHLDELTSSGEGVGWGGFFASFLIVLREGAEALLVVAAVVTYAMKAGRRDQLVGIGIGVAAALAVSVGLAVAFSMIAASASSGFGQELLEGVTGVLAVLMLIYVSNWILSKSQGNRWDAYIKKVAGDKTVRGGVFALAMVAFLAVVREGAETILFFSPILSAASMSHDYVMIWSGVGAAAVILAALFALVWFFGVKLPLRPFFKWTSILLGLLAVTIAGGAVKEFQDATLVSSTEVGGVPTISILGIYPSVESLSAQVLVALLLIALGIIQAQQAKRARTSEVGSPGSESPETDETLTVEPASEDQTPDADKPEVQATAADHGAGPDSKTMPVTK